MKNKLALIKRAAERRQQQRSALDDANAELSRLICEAFDDGITREKIADAAGLSVARVYQIKDGRR